MPSSGDPFQSFLSWPSTDPLPFSSDDVNDNCWSLPMLVLQVLLFEVDNLRYCIFLPFLNNGLIIGDEVALSSAPNCRGARPSCSCVISGMASRAFHWSHVRPAILVIDISPSVAAEIIEAHVINALLPRGLHWWLCKYLSQREKNYKIKLLNYTRNWTTTAHHETQIEENDICTLKIIVQRQEMLKNANQIKREKNLFRKKKLKKKQSKLHTILHRSQFPFKPQFSSRMTLSKTSSS